MAKAKRFFELSFVSVILLLIALVLSSLTVAALKEGETEFFEFNDQQFALTAVNVNSDGTADVIISKHVPDFAKSLNVGESQKYFSNWQCFVTTLFNVDLDKSNVYISKCMGEDVKTETIANEKKTEAKKDVATETSTDIKVEDNLTSEIKEEVKIQETETSQTLPIEETPESFLEKKISLGNVLIAGLVFFGLIMIILLFVVYYTKKGSY